MKNLEIYKLDYNFDDYNSNKNIFHLSLPTSHQDILYNILEAPLPRESLTHTYKLHNQWPHTLHPLNFDTVCLKTMHESPT